MLSCAFLFLKRYMKKSLLILIALFSFSNGFSQEEKPHFATIDTVQRESGTIVYEGVFNRDYASGFYHYDNNH